MSCFVWGYSCEKACDSGIGGECTQCKDFTPAEKIAALVSAIIETAGSDATNVFVAALKDLGVDVVLLLQKCKDSIEDGIETECDLEHPYCASDRELVALIRDTLSMFMLPQPPKEG